MPTHQGLYRNTPLILGGLLGAIALLIGGSWGAVGCRHGDELLLDISHACAALTFAACAAALRRHRWTIDAKAVLIEERPRVPLTGRRRGRRVPFGEIVALNRVQNAADELLAITTREGERFVLPPGLAPGKGLIRLPDQAGIVAFTGSLQTAMTAAGYAAPPVADGLGFWNRPAGLVLLSIALLASLALAAASLWGLWEGATTRHRGGEAVAILVMLPVGAGWMLRRSWQRRRSVVRTMGQMHPISKLP